MGEQRANTFEKRYPLWAKDTAMEMGPLISKSLVDRSLVTILNFKIQGGHGYGNKKLGQCNNHMDHKKVTFDSAK